MSLRYSQHARFEKNLKSLTKKYRTLQQDLEMAKQSAIELFHLRAIDNHAVFLVPGFDSEQLQIYKLKKFACKSLKGRGVQSGIRIIYAYYPQTKEVVFLEMYYKEKQGSDMDYDFVRLYFEQAVR